MIGPWNPWSLPTPFDDPKERQARREEKRPSYLEDEAHPFDEVDEELSEEEADLFDEEFGRFDF